MIKRKPGFLSRAQQNAKKQGMVRVPRKYDLGKKGMHYAAFITADEMQKLKDEGATGQMTEYDIPAFPAYNPGGTEKTGTGDDAIQSTAISGTEERDRDYDAPDTQDIPTPTAAPKKPEYAIGWDDSKDLWGNIMSINIPGWLAQEWDKLDFKGKPKGDISDEEKMKLLENNPDAQKQVMGNLGGPEAESAATDAVKSEAYEKDRAEDYEKEQKLQKKRTGYTEGTMQDDAGLSPGDDGYDESTGKMRGGYEGYKGEVKELGTKSKDLTEGTMQDDSGRSPGDDGYVEAEGRMRGGFAGDVEKLDKYAPQFDTLAGEAGVRGREGSAYFQGVFTDSMGRVEGDKGFNPNDPKGTRVGGAGADYKGAATTGATELDKLSTGVMTDDQGRTSDDPKYDASSGKMRGGYKQITGKDISAAATTGAEKAGELAGGVLLDDAGKKLGEDGYDPGSAKMRGGYKQITGQDTVEAAAKGTKGFIEGALGVMTDASGKTEGQEGYDASSATRKGGVQEVGEQFGKEGFQKEAGGYQSQLEGMSTKALSGDVGQREAAMLKGRMEEGRMASQKGGEEKLRRELAQSGASPSEIAAKVAQFQRQSVAQQSQAGRSDILSSQLQGQQLGQAQLTQAAGLTEKALGALGKKSGMAETRAGLDVTKAELRGKGAAMEMEGTEAQTAAKLDSLGGQSEQNVVGTEMNITGATAIEDASLKSLEGQTGISETSTGLKMKGVKGAGALTKTGIDVATDAATQEANMLGAGVDAITASGDAKVKQMEGVGQQVDIVGEQGEYTQAQLDDIIAQQTAAANKESERLTRSAQGTPDDPYYRPPEETVEPVTDPGTTGTTIPPVEEEAVPMAEGGPVQGGRPYIVGEKGKELFTPSQSGNITPNSQMPPSPTEIKQTSDHSFTIAPSSAQAPKGGINSPPQAPPTKGGINSPQPQPQLQGAPPQPQVAPPQQGAPAPGGGKEEMIRRGNAPLGAAPQPVQGGLSPLQQGGMMGGIMGGKAQAQRQAFDPQRPGGMGLPPQGNNPQTQGPKPQGMKDWGREIPINTMKHPGGIGGMAGMATSGDQDAFNNQQGGKGGIGQQGGLMAQGQLTPEQQQQAEAMHKKRQQMQMQSFQMR